MENGTGMEMGMVIHNVPQRNSICSTITSLFTCLIVELCVCAYVAGCN